MWNKKLVLGVLSAVMIFVGLPQELKSDSFEQSNDDLEEELELKNAEINVFLSHDEIFRTYKDEITGVDVSKFFVSMLVEIGSPEVSGSYLQIPLNGTKVDVRNDTFKNFTMQGSIFEVSDLPVLGVNSKFEWVKYSPGDNTITLKVRDGASGVEEVRFGFKLNETFKNNIPPHQIIWEDLHVDLVDENDVVQKSYKGRNVYSEGGQNYSLSGVYFNPTSKDYIDGKITSRITYTSNEFDLYRTDFNNYKNRIYIDVPKGSIIHTVHPLIDTSKAYTSANDANVPEGYERYYGEFNREEEAFRSLNQNNLYQRYTQVDTIITPGVSEYEIGSNFEIATGIDVKKMNGEIKNYHFSLTYTLSEALDWQLSGSGMHGTGSGIYPNPTLNLNDSNDTSRSSQIFGWTSYDHATTIKNSGVKPIQDVRYEIYNNKNNENSNYLKFKEIEIYGLSSGDNVTPPRYLTLLEITDARSLTVSKNLNMGFKTGISKIDIPKLEKYEYISKITVIPESSGTTDLASLKPNNAITIRYTAENWEDNILPDGSKINENKVNEFPISGTMFYKSSAGIRLSKDMSTNITKVAPKTTINASVKVLSSNSTSVIPDDVIDYVIQVKNDRLGFDDYRNPEIVIGIPSALELISDSKTTDFIDLTRDGSNIVKDAVSITEVNRDDDYVYYRFNTKEIGRKTIDTPSFNIPIKLKVKQGVLPGEYKFKGVTLSSSDALFLQMNTKMMNAQEEIAEKFGYSNSSDQNYSYFDSDVITPVTVAKSVSVSSQIRVKPEESDWLDANVVQIKDNSNPRVSYSISNTGTSQLDNVIMYSVLPNIDDRNESTSGFNLLNTLVEDNASIYYYEGNPKDLPDYDSDLQEWDESYLLELGFTRTPVNMKMVTAIFVSFEGVLKPGELVESILDYKVDKGNDKRAVNQFQYSFRDVETGRISNAVSLKNVMTTQYVTLNFEENLPEILPDGVSSAGNMPDSLTKEKVLGKDLLFYIPSKVPKLMGYEFLYWIDPNTNIVYYPGYSLVYDSNESQSINLEAVWRGISIKVNIYGTPTESEAFVESIDQRFGKTIDLSRLKPQEIKGYVFKGYSETPNGTIIDSYTIDSLKQHELYRVWDIHKYSIVFDANGGSGNVETISTQYNEQIEFPDNEFVRDGYTFSGYSKNPNGPVEFFPKDRAKNLTDEKEIKYYAIWSPNSYTVKYHDGDKNLNQQFTYGIAQKLQANTFNKIGYTFKGWSLSEGSSEVAYVDNELVESLVYEGNLDLYAVWDENSYSINYHNSPNDSTYSESLKYTEKKALQGNPFEKRGYRFIGWAKEIDGPVIYGDHEVVSRLSESEDINLYAQWIPITYTIQYYSNDEDNIVTSQLVSYDQEIAMKRSMVEKKSYEFLGWSRSPEGDVEFVENQVVKNLTDIHNETLELYAIWEKKELESDYYLNAHDGEINISDLSVAVNSRNLSRKISEVTNAEGYKVDKEGNRTDLEIKLVNDVTFKKENQETTTDVKKRTVAEVNSDGLKKQSENKSEDEKSNDEYKESNKKSPGLYGVAVVLILGIIITLLTIVKGAKK